MANSDVENLVKLLLADVDTITNQIDDYKVSVDNYSNVLELYQGYVAENAVLTTQLEDETANGTTNDRKTYYADQNITNLDFFYTYFLTIIYVITVICYALFSLKYPSNIDIKTKIGIIICFIVLPFISTPILGKLIEIVYWLFELLPKNSYV